MKKSVKNKYMVLYGKPPFQEVYSIASSKKEATQHIKDCLVENGCGKDEIECYQVLEREIILETKVGLK